MYFMFYIVAQMIYYFIIIIYSNFKFWLILKLTTTFLNRLRHQIPDFRFDTLERMERRCGRVFIP